MTETIPVYYTAKSMSARIQVLNDIPKERVRQERLHPQKLNLNERFNVLVEEVGEVSQALQAMNQLRSVKITDKTNLYRELIQVSAAAARMAEQVLVEGGSE